MILEDEEIERLMARKKAIQATLAAQAQSPASTQGGCSSGGCSTASAPRKAKPQASSLQGNTPTGTVLLLSLLRVAGLAAAVGVGIWALVQAL